VILTTLYIASAKNTDSWHAGKGNLQHAFPLDVLMVPSSELTVATGGERLWCRGFSLGEIIRFRSLKFIVDPFGGLSLSPMGDGLDAVIMFSTSGGPPYP
jgi:hypothetical protein